MAEIVRNYGVDATASGLNKLFIKRRSDGSCIFLQNLSGMNLCGLQQMKPNACKLWPFKIAKTPKFGYANEAAYSYGEKSFLCMQILSALALDMENQHMNLPTIP